MVTATHLQHSAGQFSSAREHRAATFRQQKNGKTAAVVMTGLWAAKTIYQKLNQKDKEAVVASARRGAATGKDQSYTGAETGVKVQTHFVKEEVKTEKVSIPVLKDRVQQVPPLDLVGETYASNGASDLRDGPGTDYKIVGSLTANQQVSVIGQVQNQPWYLIGQDGPASGFVATTQLSPVPASTTSLAEVAAPTGTLADGTGSADFTVARKYRIMQQTIETPDGQKETEQVTARQGANGWELVGAE